MGFYPIDPYPSLLLYICIVSLLLLIQFLFRIFYFSTLKPFLLIFPLLLSNFCPALAVICIDLHCRIPALPSMLCPDLHCTDLLWSDLPRSALICPDLRLVCPAPHWSGVLCPAQLCSALIWSQTGYQSKAVSGEIYPASNISKECGNFSKNQIFLLLIWSSWWSTRLLWWDLSCLLLKNQFFTSDLAILMLYKSYLVKSDLYTTQKSDFYIWFGFFDALRDFSSEIWSVYC